MSRYLAIGMILACLALVVEGMFGHSWRTHEGMNPGDDRLHGSHYGLHEVYYSVDGDLGAPLEYSNACATSDSAYEPMCDMESAGRTTTNILWVVIAIGSIAILLSLLNPGKTWVATLLMGAAGILALAAVVVWYTMHDQTYIADEVSLGLNAYMTIVGGILGILGAGMYKLIARVPFRKRNLDNSLAGGKNRV